MIIGFEGDMGSGKTANQTRYLCKDYNRGIELFTNYSLYGIEYTKFDVMDLFKLGDDIHNMSIAIDEITVYLDCRLSASNLNRIISYFILQTRKRNVNLYYTNDCDNVCR